VTKWAHPVRTLRTVCALLLRDCTVKILTSSCKLLQSVCRSSEFILSIRRRIFNHLLSVQLLDACASNCGKIFHLEIASRDFENDLRKLINHPQPKIVEKIKALLKKWVEGDFKIDPQLNLIPSLYNKLKSEGHDFSSVSDTVSHHHPTMIMLSHLFHQQQNIELHVRFQPHFMLFKSAR